MKTGFDLGTRVSTKDGRELGTLVAGKVPHGHTMTHYSGEGFYFVKWDSRTETYVAHEDDLRLVSVKPLYKTTIVIWSDYNPSDESEVPDYDNLTALARQAVSGDAYCSKMKSEQVKNPAADADWDGTEFFGENDEEDHEVQPG